MDVLISALGDHDPFPLHSDVKGPVLTLAEQIRPQRIYLLPTKLPAGQESGPLSSETFARALKARERILASDERLTTETVTIHLLVVPDASDYLHVFDALRGAARRIISELAHVEALSFHVNASSGTPALQAGMLLMVNAGLLSRSQDPPVRVYQVASRSLGPEGRIARVDTSLLELGRLIDQACLLFDRGAYDAASVVFQRLADIAANADRKQSARAAERYVVALDAHRRLSYPAASDMLNELIDDQAVHAYLHGLLPIMRHQAVHLQSVLEGDRAALAYDLLLDAERQRRLGAYADSLDRCWHVVEATLRHRASTMFNIDVDRAPETGHGYVALLIKNLEMCGDDAIATCIATELDEPLRTQIDDRLRDRLATGSRPLRDALFVEFKLARSWTDKVKPSEQEETAVVRWALSRLASTGMVPVSTYGDLGTWITILHSYSVAANGLCDIDDLDAEAALVLTRSVVAAAFGPLPDAHPFALGSHQQVASLLRQSLHAV